MDNKEFLKMKERFIIDKENNEPIKEAVAIFAARGVKISKQTGETIILGDFQRLRKNYRRDIEGIVRSAYIHLMQKSSKPFSIVELKRLQEIESKLKVKHG